VQLETAGVIAADVIRTLGDTGNKLAETLGWSMEEVRVRILNDPLSKISKTKFVIVTHLFHFILQIIGQGRRSSASVYSIIAIFRRPCIQG